MTRSSWLWAGGSREGEPDEHCRAGRSHRLEPQRGTGRPFGASSKTPPTRASSHGVKQAHPAIVSRRSWIQANGEL
jgi:hypothetical protein